MCNALRSKPRRRPHLLPGTLLCHPLRPRPNSLHDCPGTVAFIDHQERHFATMTRRREERIVDGSLGRAG